MKNHCHHCKSEVRINSIYHTLHTPTRYFCTYNCYKTYLNNLHGSYFPN